MHRSTRLLAVIALSAGAGFVASAPVQARGELPSLKMISVVKEATAARYPWGGFYFSPGAYVGATNGAFELEVTPLRDGTLDVWQVTRTDGRLERVRHLPKDAGTSMQSGLGAFFQLRFTSVATGRVVSTIDLPFCPNGWPVRADDTGPDKPSYPFTCGSPLTKKMVWGMDKGWAQQALLWLEDPGVSDGDYDLRIAIASKYVKALQVPSTAAAATIRLTVTTLDDGGCKPGEPCAGMAGAGGRVGGGGEARPVRDGEVSADHENITPTVAGADGMPDLAVLPAHNLWVEHLEDGTDRMSFGATIWNAGSGPLVVEGFRNSPAEVMPARQYIYSGGVRVASYAAGAFEYDRREGHTHWHFEDIATYELLTGNGVVRSGKQSFCLAPTDPIDLSLKGAMWIPDFIGLGSACGGEDAIWLREVLPAGWGDTYFQSAPGQSFDVTTVPNGRYTLRVSTNAGRTVTEARTDNNVADITVDLGGSPGARTATVVG